MLITAVLAGSGKTHLLLELHDPTKRCLYMVPTHAARQNVLSKAREMRIDLNDEDVRTFASLFYRSDGRLHRYDLVFIDELYQLSIDNLSTVFQATLKYPHVRIIGAGAWDQTPAVGENNHHDLRVNKFLTTQFFPTVLELDYLKGSGRFDGNYHQDLLSLTATGRLPEHFKDKHATEEHNMHLCLKKETRDKMAKICCRRHCEPLPEDQKLDPRAT